MPLTTRCLVALFCIMYFQPRLATAQVPNTHPRPVKVKWTDKLTGDYSFRNQWSYQPGVSRQADGRVLCDGLCPPQMDGMLDSLGNILPDSISAYYRLIDTTHFYHTLTSEAHCYEWAGADYIAACRRHDTLAADTYCNPATHSSLRIRIVGDKCYATIIVNSIHATRNKKPIRYYCQKGDIKIDRKLLAKGVLKAQFDFTFRAPRAFGPMYWRGRIYKTIEPPRQYEGMWLN